jgi:hypothetical protein
MRDHDRTFLSLGALASLLSILLVNGCSRDVPVAPALRGGAATEARASLAASPAGAFFPLIIGNRWHATAVFRVTVTPNQGSPYSDAFHQDISRELIGTEALFGRTYVVMREDVVETGPGESSSGSSWTRYRQDASGLYEADVSALQPPGSEPVLSSVRTASASGRREFPGSLASRMTAVELQAYRAAWDRIQDRIAAIRRGLGQEVVIRADGLMPNEITRLRYPLHPGATWDIRTDPDLTFTSIAEAVEPLNLPVGNLTAWRIRIWITGLSDQDSVHLWIGRSGQLQFTYHLVGIATDEDGNVIGTTASDYSETVDRIDLVKP